MSELNVTNENVVGLDVGSMNMAVSDLGDLKTAFTTWCEQLVTLKDLVARDWLGGAQDTFSASYGTLVNTMMTTIELAGKLQNHGQDSIDVITTTDSNVSMEVEERLRIG